MIRVRLWGTRGSITSPGQATWRYGGNTPCVQLSAFQTGEPGAAVRPDNPQLILDGGSGLALLQTRLMQGLCGRGQGELHIMLTHYHWDHIIGLPFFIPLMIKGNRVHFYGVSVDDLQTSVERLFTSVYSPVKSVHNVAATLTYHPIRPEGTEIEGFQVRAVETNHRSKTWAFCIQHGSTVVVYSPDHEAGDSLFDTSLINLARDADLWMLDAQYNSQERPHHQGWGHSSHLEAVNLALEANVNTLVLFHHNQDHNDETLDRMKVEAVEAAANSRTEVLMGRDGMAIDVGNL